MELCKGFKNWLECLKCPHLCTDVCPVEGKNVMDKMKSQMQFLSESRISHKLKDRGL